MVFLCFLVTLVFNFGIILFLLRPTSDQKQMEKRLDVLRNAGDPEESKKTLDLELYLKTLKRGHFGWLEDRVANTMLARQIRLLIIQSDSATAVGTVLAHCVGGLLLLSGAAWYFTGNPLVALPLGLLGGYLPIALLAMKRSRRVAKFNAGMPDCIDMLARSLRAGHSLVAAIGIVAESAAEPVRTEFDEVYKKQNYGLPFREALMQLLERVPSQDLRVLVTGILVQKDTGGNLAEILDRILFVIKERVRIQGEIRTHTAQGRMTGWILCALPIIMLALINIVNPGYSNVLFTDPLGKKMLYTGCFLLVIGGLIIRQIVNGIEV
jgi:tight adherence protein B